MVFFLCVFLLNLQWQCVVIGRSTIRDVVVKGSVRVKRNERVKVKHNRKGGMGSK